MEALALYAFVIAIILQQRSDSRGHRPRITLRPASPAVLAGLGASRRRPVREWRGSPRVFAVAPLVVVERHHEPRLPVRPSAAVLVDRSCSETLEATSRQLDTWRSGGG
jgi:hypothetical protein